MIRNLTAQSRNLKAVSSNFCRDSCGITSTKVATDKELRSETMDQHTSVLYTHMCYAKKLTADFTRQRFHGNRRLERKFIILCSKLSDILTTILTDTEGPVYLH